MSCSCYSELRRRAKGDREHKMCRYAEELKDGGIRCAVDGSIRKKGCPCVKYEGRLSHRLMVAIDYIFNG